MKKCIFRTLEQAGTNICSMGACSVARKNILNKVHIVHCNDHSLSSANMLSIFDIPLCKMSSLDTFENVVMIRKSLQLIE